MMRPVRIMSSARPSPTMRGRRWVPPSISGTPQRRSGKPRRESSVAIRRSHHSASSRPAGEREAGDRGDGRLGGRQAGEAHRPLRRGEALAEGLERLQVGAGAERDAARAGEHQHARLLVGLEAQVGLVQRRGGGAVDGVAPLLAVDRQQRGGAAALVADGGSPPRGGAHSHRWRALVQSVAALAHGAATRATSLAATSRRASGRRRRASAARRRARLCAFPGASAAGSPAG